MDVKKKISAILFSLFIGSSFASDLIPDVSISSVGQQVIINIPQARLFLFENGNLLASYPVGAGKPRTQTPLGSHYEIESKSYKPTWTIPESIRRERRDGKRSIPYGAPGHPLGPVFVRFGPSLGIHGTSSPSSVPGWPSHGCVRMHNKNALAFAAQVQTGTPVSVIHQRYSLNEDGEGNLWLGVYPNIYQKADSSSYLISAIQEWNNSHDNQIDMDQVHGLLKKKNRLVCLNCDHKTPVGGLKAISWTQGLAESSELYGFSSVNSYEVDESSIDDFETDTVIENDYAGFSQNYSTGGAFTASGQASSFDELFGNGSTQQSAPAVQFEGNSEQIEVMP